MPWPRDDAKLGRVRALMAEHELDALVVRAPDNVLYLTNFWGMKGYDAVVFPARGRPGPDLPRSVAGRRRANGLDDGDPALRRLPRERSPAAGAARPRPRAADRLRATTASALELSLGTQAADRMVGEPTTYPKAWFDAFPDAADATPLLAQARAIKTEQEIERMRLANEIAARRDGARPGAHPARDARERGRRDVERLGARPRDRLRRARSTSRTASRSSGRGRGSARSPRPAAGRSPEHEPTLFEIWVCADGYWCDHTKNLVPGELEPRYAELEQQLMLSVHLHHFVPFGR